MPTNFGLGFCIEFTGTNFGSIIFYWVFASNFNGVNFWGHILHPNCWVIYFASDFVTNFLRHIFALNFCTNIKLRSGK